MLRITSKAVSLFFSQQRLCELEAEEVDGDDKEEPSSADSAGSCEYQAKSASIELTKENAIAACTFYDYNKRCKHMYLKNAYFFLHLLIFVLLSMIQI